MDVDDLKCWQKWWLCFFCVDKILCREQCKKFDEKDFDSENGHESTKNSKNGMNCCQTLGLGMCCFLFWPVLIPLGIFYAICRMLNYFCCGKSCSQNNIFCKNGIWHCGSSECKSPCPCDCCIDPLITVQETEDQTSNYSSTTSTDSDETIVHQPASNKSQVAVHITNELTSYESTDVSSMDSIAVEPPSPPKKNKMRKKI